MATLQGIYYPPNSAQRQEAVIELEANGQLRLALGDLGRAWSTTELEFSDRLGGLPCTITFPDGGKFETPDDPAITEWLQQHGGSRRGSWVHMLERRWKWVAVSFVTVIVGLALFLWVGLPAAAGWIADRVPARVRVETGRQAMKVVERMLGKGSTTPLSRVAQIQLEFEDLVGLRPIPALRPHLEIRSGGMIGPNAFAVPDGTVMLTDELIEVAPDEAAIQGVLAHELGHLYHNHAMEEVVRASSLPLIVTLLTGDLGSGASLAGSIPIQLIRNGYSRGAEREADNFALELMRERDLDPGSMANFFEILQEKYGDMPGWISTHPENMERIRFFREAAGTGAAPAGAK